MTPHPTGSGPDGAFLCLEIFMPIEPFSSRDIPDEVWDANAAQWRADQDRYFADGDDTVSGGSGDDTVALAATPRLGKDRPGSGPILGLISEGEGTSGPNGYDVTFNNESGQRYPAGWKKPTELTVDQWLQLQPILARMNGGSAMGKYQLMPDTLRELKGAMGLKGSELMTPELQDQMGEQRLYKRGYGDFVAGRITPEAFQERLSQEWSSLPKGAEGNSYYPDKHKGPVRARVPVDRTLAAMKAARDYENTLNQQIDRGQLPP